MVMEWIEILLGCNGLQMAFIPVLAIAGLAAAGAGAIGSGVTRQNQKKKLSQMQADIRGQMADNRSWYNANYLTDYTQRADAQNLFKHLQDGLRRRRDITTATAAVTGATPAAQAAAKEADARVIGDTYSNVAALGQRYKDNVTNQYLRRQDLLNARMLGLDQQDYAGYDRMAGSWMNLMGSGLNTAAGAFDSYYSGQYGKDKAGYFYPQNGKKIKVNNLSLLDAVNEANAVANARQKWYNT